MMGDEEYNCNGNKKADMVKEALLKEMEELKMQNDRLYLSISRQTLSEQKKSRTPRNPFAAAAITNSKAQAHAG